MISELFNGGYARLSIGDRGIISRHGTQSFVVELCIQHVFVSGTMCIYENIYMSKRGHMFKSYTGLMWISPIIRNVSLRPHSTKMWIDIPRVRCLCKFDIPVYVRWLQTIREWNSFSFPREALTLVSRRWGASSMSRTVFYRKTILTKEPDHTIFPHIRVPLHCLSP